MGLSRTTIQLLLNEAAVRPFSGSAVTLGRQHIYFSWEDFQHLARNASVAMPGGITPRLHREVDLARRGYASDATIFSGLGFSECRTLDYSDYEAVNEIFDLSQPETPLHLQNRFDLVLDTGTMEHVFHVPNVLANLHRMLKPGGRLIHLTPAANYLDHGFYSFSPTFFADYYHVNRYAIHQVCVCRHTTKGENSPVQVFDYLNRGPSGFDVGSLDDHVYNNWVVVQRREDSTCGIIPQQSAYLTRWADSSSGASSAGSWESEPAGTKADRLLKLTARWGPLHRLARGTIRAWRGLVNRYRKKFQFPLPKVGEYR